MQSSIAISELGDLLHEPLGTEDRREFGTQHLERDLAVVPKIVREVHGRHAAAPEFPLDSVAVGEGGREAGG